MLPETAAFLRNCSLFLSTSLQTSIQLASQRWFICPLGEIEFWGQEVLNLVASQVALVVKNPLADAGDVRDAGSIPGLERSPGVGHGNPLQHSCLGNPMDTGAWRATVHRVAQSQTQLKQLSTHAHAGLQNQSVLFPLQLKTGWGSKRRKTSVSSLPCTLCPLMVKLLKK